MSIMNRKVCAKASMAFAKCFSVAASVATVVSLATVISTSPVQAGDLEFVDGVASPGLAASAVQPSSTFEEGLNLGAAFAGGDAVGSLDELEGESRRVELVPLATLQERQNHAVGLAALVERARANFEKQGGRADGNGLMRLDQSLSEILGDLAWRREVVQTLYSAD